MTPQLRDAEFTVRPYTVDDAPALHAVVHASLDSLSASLPWCHPGYALADAQSWIAWCLLAWQERREFPFAIVAADGTILGGIGLNRLNPDDRSANLGYWLGDAHRGRGIVTRAARLVADFGFRELGLARLEIVTLLENTASQRVAQRLGARCEGIGHDRIMLHGQPHDALVFSLRRAATSPDPTRPG